MDAETNMKDWQSQEFQQGYDAWCDCKGIKANPYEEYTIDWVEWNQGWKEAQGFNFDQD